MKKLIPIFLLVLFTIPCVAGTSPIKKIVLVSETAATVGVTAELVSVPDNGYIELFTHAKIYYTMLGTTPNTSSKYLNAGNAVDFESFRYKNQYIGLLSDSGTASYNITVYKYAGE